MERADRSPFELLGYDCHLLKLEAKCQGYFGADFGPLSTTTARNGLPTMNFREFNFIVQTHRKGINTAHSGRETSWWYN